MLTSAGCQIGIGRTLHAADYNRFLQQETSFSFWQLEDPSDNKPWMAGSCRIASMQSNSQVAFRLNALKDSADRKPHLYRILIDWNRYPGSLLSVITARLWYISVMRPLRSAPCPRRIERRVLYERFFGF